MADLRVVPFEPGHLSGVQLRASARRGLEVLTQTFPMMGQLYAMGGPAWTLLDGERPLACGGMMRLWPGVAEGWVCPSDEVLSRFPMALVKAVRSGLEEGRVRLKLRRLQASIPVDEPWARRWAAHMGMTEEGLMPAYGPDGRDQLRVARLWSSAEYESPPSSNPAAEENAAP
ncbi:MAG: hypothetical protein HQL51_08855 [Magnetococcales bacterium]|nr:hypothetical protein [Magnetococcales bacterium]